jgi:hypothetical protein
MSIQYANPGKSPQERSPMKLTTRPIHKIAVIAPVDYCFGEDHKPPTMEQDIMTGEADPLVEVERVQELPRAMSWAYEMEEEYNLNGPQSKNHLSIRHLWQTTAKHNIL